MRKLMRGFLNWLDKRFPERVVITQAEFLTLKAQIEVLSKALSEERIKKIEAEISKFNVSMGFSGAPIPKMATAAFQR